MPEFAGFILAPLIIYFAFKLGAEGRGPSITRALACSHGLFLMTHIPVALLMTYALGFYALVWAAREKRLADRAFAVSLGISIALIISGDLLDSIIS